MVAVGTALVSIAAVAVVGTGGALAPFVIGGMTMGGVMVAGQAIADCLSGQVSDIETYRQIGFWGAVAGAVSGGVGSCFSGLFSTKLTLAAQMGVNGLGGMVETVVENAMLGVKTELSDLGLAFGMSAFLPGIGDNLARGAKRLAGQADNLVRGLKGMAGQLDNVLRGAGRQADDMLEAALKQADDLAEAAAKQTDDMLEAAGKQAGDVAEDATKQADVADSLPPPRYGDRRISDKLYAELRESTPTRKIRDHVNIGIDSKIGMPDPAIPTKVIGKQLEADHIVSMDKITKMEGFDQLTCDQQLAILNFEDNFMGLSKSANASKGSKSYSEWTLYVKENIPIDAQFRAKMMELESKLERILQKMIDDFLA